MAGTPTSGVISNSYVSKRKPMEATVRMSHCVRENPFSGDFGGTLEFMRVNVNKPARPFQ
jgi:hypothetical protein